MSESGFQYEKISKLSDRFFGDRILKIDECRKMQTLLAQSQGSPQQVEQIYLRVQQLFAAKYQSEMASANAQQTAIFNSFLSNLFEECCVKLRLDANKTSSAIEICVEVFLRSFHQYLTSEQSFNYFRDVLIRHSLFKPPTSTKIFDPEDLRALSRYLLHTFYKHYDLYFFAYTPKRTLEINTFEIFKSRFPYVDSLEDAQVIDRAEIPLLQEYLVDKETGLTPEQLEE